MKIFSFLKQTSKMSGHKVKKNLRDYKEELLVKHGREQFKKMLDKGLQVPIVLL